MGREDFEMLSEKIRRLKKQNELMVEALELILPLAKGYARQYNVGSNHKYIIQAQQALKSAKGEE